MDRDTCATCCPRRTCLVSNVGEGQILAGGEICHQDCPVLQAPCYYGHGACLRAFLAAGAAVDARGRVSSLTGLMIACLYKRDECVRLLIAAGASLDLQDDETGATSLILASMAGHVGCVLLLLQAGANTNVATHDGQSERSTSFLLAAAAGVDADLCGVYDGTALIYACAAGHLECARLLLRGGASVNATDRHGRTALMHACSKGHSECVHVLLCAKAAVDAETASRWTALTFACCCGYDECVSLLLRACGVLDLNHRIGGGTGITALTLACSKGHLECARLLLGAGVDNANSAAALTCACSWRRAACVRLLLQVVDVAGEVGRRALAIACDAQCVTIDVNCIGSTAQKPVAGVSAEILHLLLGAGAVIDNDNGGELLVSASLAGSCDVVNALINEGVSANAEDSHGTTALWASCSGGHHVCARLLIDRGALVNKPCPRATRKTALAEACYFGHHECVRVLLEAGASVDPRALLWACCSGHGECVRMLVSRGVNVDVCVDGTRPICAASSSDECLRVLLEAGATVDAPALHGKTALWLACKHGRPRCVRRLLQHGAGVNVVCEGGFTPLMVACEGTSRVTDYETCVRILLDNGATVNATSDDGSTAIMFALTDAYMRLLLKGGADVNATARNRSTALMGAATRGLGECMRLLLENGAMVDVEDAGGVTALMRAMLHRHVACVLTLLEFGARIDRLGTMYPCRWHVRWTSEVTEIATHIHVAVGAYAYDALVRVLRRDDASTGGYFLLVDAIAVLVLKEHVVRALGDFVSRKRLFSSACGGDAAPLDVCVHGDSRDWAQRRRAAAFRTATRWSLTSV